MARGYYTRSVIVAWDFRNGALTRRWTFGTNASGNGAYAGQGNHQLSVADVDADGRDEIVYGAMTHIDKYGTAGDTRLLTAAGVHANNGTKSTPSLSADILGDWREEVIWPTTDNTALSISSTPSPTTVRLYTLMHDPQYRTAVAWQNTAYNQPPHPSYHIGNGMVTPPAPHLFVR